MWMLSAVFSSFCCCQVNISELGLVTQSGKVVWGKSARVHQLPWSYPRPVSLPQGSTHRSQTILRMTVVSMQSYLYEHTHHTHIPHSLHYLKFHETIIRSSLVGVTVTGGCDGGRGVKEKQMMGNGGSDMTGGATLHVMGG